MSPRNNSSTTPQPQSPQLLLSLMQWICFYTKEGITFFYGPASNFIRLLPCFLAQPAARQNSEKGYVSQGSSLGPRKCPEMDIKNWDGL